MSAMGGSTERFLGWLVKAGFAVLLMASWRRWIRGLSRLRTPLKRAAAGGQDRVNEILAQIEESPDLTAVPRAFSLLMTNGDPAVRLRAEQAISKRVKRLPAIQLKRLDSLFRQRTSLEWDLDRKRADPDDLLLPALSETEKTIMLGLASFHPNGYYREKAIRALARTTTGDELPYLIIRLNDWVLPIWNLSYGAVRQRLGPQNARAIIHALPLIFRMADRSRDHHFDLRGASIEVLSRPDIRPELELGLRSKDSLVRRCCYLAIIRSGAFDNPAVLERLMHERSPMNRAFVLRQISAGLTAEEIRPYRTALLRDRSAAVRLTAMRIAYQFDPLGSRADLERALVDEDPAVREAARYLLGASGPALDLPAIYRRLLTDPATACPGAIAGLGETGQPGDAGYVAPFLKASQVRWVRSSLRASARLDFAGSKGVLISFLADGRPGVAKEARRLLSGRIDASDAALIHRDYFRDRPDALRRRAALLFCGLDKWDALPYILELQADPQAIISEIGGSALIKWQARYNRSFVAPTQAQLKAARAALAEYGRTLPGRTRDLLEFNLAGFP